MAKYKIKIGKKKLSDEQINKFKDFKKLRHEYDDMVKPLYRKPLYKNKKAFLVLLVIVILAYIISEYFK